MILRDYAPEPANVYQPVRTLDINQYYYGKVTRIEKGKTPQIFLDFGVPKGVVPTEALIRTAKILSIPTYRPYEEHLREMLDKVKVGDVLFGEVMEYDSESHEGVIELKKKPTVNGGLISLDQGEVRAVVSGFDSEGFNRAVFATRQPGSIFKSVVFYAALQMGWTILDRLDNERRLFSFQGKFYFPRGDHPSPYDDTSMLWSGIKSENLATVYLTAHLLDKLNFEEFKQLLGSMDLLPHEGEAPRDYHFRVAKDTGVQLDNNGVREAMLDRAIAEIRPDLIFAGRMNMLKDIGKIWWGRGYLSELQQVYRMADDDVTDRERNLRLTLVKRNWERLSMQAQDLRQDWAKIQAVAEEGGADAVLSDATTLGLIGRFRVVNVSGHKPSLAYVKEYPGEEFRPGAKGAHVVIDPPPGRPLNSLDVQSIWENEGASISDVSLEGILPLRYQERIAQGIESLYAAAMNQKDPYSLYQYFSHHDFRIIAGLKYLVHLSRAMGVYSKLEPVLSFGLGTNDVSVSEVAKVYQTFADGKTYRFYKDGPDNQLNFIRRIEDRDGKVLYEPKKEVFQLTDECYAAQMGEILKKVVTHGTGRRARGELYLDYSDEDPNAPPTAAEKGKRIGVPAFGKTGTTNDYTTAYFAGYVPYPVKKNEPLDPMHNSYVIASYVGFDLNKSMRRGGFRISGAMGALPIWSDYAKAMIKELKYKDFLDPQAEKMIGVQSWPTTIPTCTSPTGVDLPGGLVLQGGGDSDAYEFTNFDKEGEVFQNEFARSSSVRAYVNLATVLSGGARAPRRAFQPFLKPEAEGQGITPKIIEGQSSGQAGAANQAPAPVLPVMETAAAERKDSPAASPVPPGGDLQAPLPADEKDRSLSRGVEPPQAEKKLDPSLKDEEAPVKSDDEFW